MTLEEIQDEYDRRGRLSNEALSELRRYLRSADPYTAITVTADCAATDLSDDLLACLESSDQMVRWNAAAALFTRFRSTEYVEACKGMAVGDQSSMVRAVALCGIGEVLPYIKSRGESGQLAALLLETFLQEKELPEVRAAAYEGMLAAQQVPPLERPPASRQLDMDRDVDSRIVNAFRAKWLQ